MVCSSPEAFELCWFCRGRSAEVSVWWEPDGEALAGGIVLTPVSALRYAAPLQPSASAESKSRGEQLAAQMRAPPTPARARGRTPTPSHHLPAGTTVTPNHS